MTTIAAQSDAHAVNSAALRDRVRDVSHLLGIHAGGIELAAVTPDGDVRVSFTGMCTGCPYRAVTLATTIMPAITELVGVRSVHADGVRVSEHAARRLAAISTGWWKTRPDADR
ncbi:MAG: NifU family protein [Acidimicrobiales bacterium]